MNWKIRPEGGRLRTTLVGLSLALVVQACTVEEPRTKTGSSFNAKQSPTAEERAVVRSGKPFYRPTGSGPAFWGPGDLYTFLATGEETGNAYFQLEALVPPGGGPPPHIHHGEDESFYLAQGSLEMRLGDAVVSAKAGDFVNVPRGTIHGFRNVGTETVKMIATYVPAGFEKYFEEVFPPATDRTANPPPPTDELIRRMTAVAPKYRCEILPSK